MKQPNYLYKGIIINVVDGDTLDIEIDLWRHTVSRWQSMVLFVGC